MPNGDTILPDATPTPPISAPAGEKKTRKYKITDPKSGDSVVITGPADNPDQNKLRTMAAEEFRRRAQLRPADVAKAIPRGLVRGAVATPALIGQMGRAEIEAAAAPFTAKTDLPPAPSIEQLAAPIERGISAATGGRVPFEKPTTQGGKLGERVGEFVGDIPSWIGPGGPIVKGLTAIISGVGSYLGERFGGPIGGVAGGMVGGGISGFVSPRGLPERVPSAIRKATTEAGVKAASKEGYQELSMLNYPMREDQAQTLQSAIRDYLVNAPETQFRDFREKGTFGAIEELTAPYGGKRTQITVNDVERVRQSLVNVRMNGGSDGVAADHAIEILDDYLLNLPGVAGISEKARKNWAAYKRGQIIDDTIRRAVDRAGGGGTGGNIDNVLRQEFRTRIRNKENVWNKFTEREQQEIERILNPGIELNFARVVSGLSPLRHRLLGGLFAAGSYGVTHDPLYAVATIAAGEGAHLIAEYMQLGRAKRVGEMTRARSPAGGYYTPRPIPSRTETGAAGALRAGGSSAFSPGVSDALELPEITVHPGD